MLNIAQSPSPTQPCYVDLDGTLVQSDLLIESILRLAKEKPLYVFLLPFWLLRGRAHLKRRVAETIAFWDVSYLPYNEEVIAFLRGQRAGRRRLILATAADYILAEKVSAHLGLFDTVIASDGRINCSGSRKLQLILEDSGQAGFAYAGNSAADLQIWSKADDILIVNASSSVIRRASTPGKPLRVFHRKPALRQLFKTLRPHQWAKNVLLFLPVLLAHRYREVEPILRAMVAFVAFSLCASSGYLLNDLLDLEADRKHPTKSTRPFASGTIPLVWGVVLAPSLLLLSGAVALTLGRNVLLVVIGYYITSLSYSLWVKTLIMWDVILLAGLYTVRVFAGGLATGTAVSHWLMAFSMFTFLSLALLKRTTELNILTSQHREYASGRGYRTVDLVPVVAFGAASTCLSILVLALYVSSDEVTSLYRHPGLLWLLCPLVFSWMGRVWVLACRGQVHDDPVIFAITDKSAYAFLATSAALFCAAQLP